MVAFLVKAFDSCDRRRGSGVLKNGIFHYHDGVKRTHGLQVDLRSLQREKLGRDSSAVEDGVSTFHNAGAVCIHAVQKQETQCGLCREQS